MYYSQGTIPSPGLQSAGDLKIAAHSPEQVIDQTESFLSRADLHFAFSPVQNYGMILYRNKFKDTFYYDENEYLSEGKLNGVGLGYYKFIRRNLSWESYLSYGSGNLKISTTQGLERIDADLKRIALQLGFFAREDMMETFYSCRLSNVRYSNINGALAHSEGEENAYLSNASNLWIPEFSYGLRFGYKPVKVQVQIGVSRNLTVPDFKMNNINLTWGLFFNIDELYQLF